MSAKADIGVIGLAVMGENLILNFESRNLCVACFNRSTDKVDAFLNARAKGRNIVGCHSLAEFVGALARPRKMLMMIRAGKAVDECIDQLLPLLEPGDTVMDGGNSHFDDTTRREAALRAKGILYVGTGVSGGEEGALHGPAIMPGGNAQAWAGIQPMFEAAAARAHDGKPCCVWIGNAGSGHFVKMVHNGIEYGDMQLICEAYDLMSRGLGMKPAEMKSVFQEWNKGVLDSYLIEITSDILGVIDEKTGQPLVDLILDVAGQKGTGKWTSVSALDLGIPTPQITEAVFARGLSALKDERVTASKSLSGPTTTFSGDKQAFLRDLHDAVYAAKICSYAQGFHLMQAASNDYGWSLKLGEIAAIWRGGCIIRARFLDRIMEAYGRNASLAHLLLDPYFKDTMNKQQTAWRRTLQTAISLGIPMPAMMSAITYFDSYRAARLPANLLQAQRDYFGAHTYERVDRPRGEFFHTNWTGTGGATASQTYTA